MTHLKRAGALLIVVLVAAFVVPRVIPVPEELTDFGFHTTNPQVNAVVWASQPLLYANTQICNDCHQTEYAKWNQADHSGVSCETCHSPAAAHLEGGPPPEVNTSRELCATCHDSLASRPEGFPQVDTGSHGGQELCITCHNPHEPREQLPPGLPHTLEGRENCQACHAPVEPLTDLPPPVMHTLEGREDCRSCHDPNRNQGEETPQIPRIPHDLEGRDNCLVCHNSSSIRPFPENHADRTSDTCRTCHQTDS